MKKDSDGVSIKSILSAKKSEIADSPQFEVLGKYTYGETGFMTMEE
jgi:hypothetical protein